MAAALSFEGSISLMKKWRSLGIGISARGIEHVESRLWSTRIFRTATDLRDSDGGAEFGSCAKIQPSVASEAIRYLTIHICTDPLNECIPPKWPLQRVRSSDNPRRGREGGHLAP